MRTRKLGLIKQLNMDVSVALKNKTQFLSLTTLYPDEFETLLLNFAPLCEKHFRYNTLEGKKRKIISSKEHGHTLLKGSDQKLFFLLVYLKSNVLQEHQAASFGISQTKVSRISRVLIEVLNQTLYKMGLMPVRNSEQLHLSLANHPTKVFSYDGLERKISRNLSDDAQQEAYSGKKKVIKSRII